MAVMSNPEFDPGFEESIMSSPSISIDSLLGTLIHDHHPSSTQPPVPHELDDICCEGMCRSVSYETENTPISHCIGGPFSWSIELEADSPLLPDRVGVADKKAPGSTDYEHMLDSSILIYDPVGPLTYQNPISTHSFSPEAFRGATSFTTTPTPSLPVFRPASTFSPWAQPYDGLDEQLHEFKTPELKQHSQRLLDGCSLYGINTPSQMRIPQTMMNGEAKQMAPELDSAQHLSSGKQSPKRKSAPVEVVRRATRKCDYPGGHKAFRRNEHLKRHKLSFHGEGPNRFSCEFCGKDQFNRQDNLNNHRKLHARPNSRNRGVEYITAAVPVIKREERNRKRRKSSKAEGAGFNHRIVNE